MEGSSIHAVELVFLLLMLFVVVFASLARKLQLPYPIVLVIAGLALSFIPGIPKISISPPIIFLVVLPPLLYSAAWYTSWRDFSYNIVSISFLAVGLVGFTVLGVAEAAHLAFNFDRRLGFVLGAVVATTDAIAATAIARRLGLPRRIVDVLEGESLVNDSTGLLALSFGVAMLVSGQTPTIAFGAFRLIYLCVIGIAIGLLVAFVIEKFERHLDDGPIEIMLSVMIPYVTYLAADYADASGVLAVVACGLYLSRRSNTLFSPNVRLQAYGFWNSLTFALNGFVFVLIGLQLPFVLSSIHDLPLRTLLLYGAMFSAIVIVLRLLWVFPGAYVGYLIRTRIFRQRFEFPGARGVFVVGWTGMRGVIALAAALALPETLANGTPFPQRNLILFLTFSVILVTLVLQGLTLPPLIRALGLAGAVGPDCEEKEARRIILETALQHLEAQRSTAPGADGDTLAQGLSAAYDDLAMHYKKRLDAVARRMSHKKDDHATIHTRVLLLSRDLLRLERDTAVRLRNEGRINDEVLRQIEHELDLSETRLDAAHHH
jgi:monovalent cation/hydrogen antiporter